MQRFLLQCRMMLFLFFCILNLNAQANTSLVTLNLQNANLNMAIHLLAQFLHINVIVSPTVNGLVILHLERVNPAAALNLLLAANGLAKWQEGNVIYIAPRIELVKQKEDAIHYQQLVNDTTPLATALWQINYAKAQDIARLLNDAHASLLTRRGHVSVDARMNMLCVQDTPVRLQIIYHLVERLDRPVQQVSIAARLANVDSDYARQLGIQYDVTTSTAQLPGAGQYSLAIGRLADGSLLDVKLAALENSGHAELISSPRLSTANQQSASIESGEEVPYQEVSDSGGTAIAFKKAVLGLRVTPQVLPGNKVLLQLQINQDRLSNQTVLGMPTITTHQMITNILVKSGQTIVLGGIYEINNTNAEQQLPFISRLPVIGWLFRQQQIQISKRELLIFVTPTVIT